MYMPDQIAGTNPPTLNLRTFHADAKEAYNSLIPAGTWTWRTHQRALKDSLKHHAQRYHFKQYRTKHDAGRSPHNPDGRLNHSGWLLSLEPFSSCPSAIDAGSSNNSTIGWCMPTTSLRVLMRISDNRLRHAPSVAGVLRNTPPDRVKFSLWIALVWLWQQVYMCLMRMLSVRQSSLKQV